MLQQAGPAEGIRKQAAFPFDADSRGRCRHVDFARVKEMQRFSKCLRKSQLGDQFGLRAVGGVALTCQCELPADEAIHKSAASRLLAGRRAAIPTIHPHHRVADDGHNQCLTDSTGHGHSGQASQRAAKTLPAALLAVEGWSPLRTGEPVAHESWRPSSTMSPVAQRYPYTSQP